MDMEFIIQLIDGKVQHDFSLELMESIKYNKWLDGKKIQHIFTEDEYVPEYCPVGSVEFVLNYLKVNFDLEPKPKNVPDELLSYHFTGRDIFNGTEKDIKGKMFVKSNDQIKGFTAICNEAPIGNYQISSIIDDITSEWRAFVYNGKLVGLKNYTGRFDVFPDVDMINDMIKTYKSGPIAYTLDVGVVHEDTFVIEVHDFFSCGLYGFNDHRILPHMFYRWFIKYLIENNEIS